MTMITVNLTTTKNRLYLCSQAVWSLAHQTAHIDAIRVWVSKDPYLIDEGIESEPEWVMEINSRWVKGIMRLVNKIKRVIITNLGYPCCNTDLDIKRVDSYFDK